MKQGSVFGLPRVVHPQRARLWPERWSLVYGARPRHVGLKAWRATIPTFGLGWSVVF